MLVQRVVEEVTGDPLDKFMATQVFKPPAMNHSDYVWNTHIAQSLLPGTKANDRLRATKDLTIPIAAFSLYTTAADYGKFLVAVFNDGDVIRRLLASRVSVDPGLGFSWVLGWEIERAPEDPHIWQWGRNNGYPDFAIASVRMGDGFVMLTNSENGLALAEPITRKIVPGEHCLRCIAACAG